jgi:hypothetical protein
MHNHPCGVEASGYEYFFILPRGINWGDIPRKVSFFFQLEVEHDVDQTGSAGPKNCE